MILMKDKSKGRLVLAFYKIPVKLYKILWFLKIQLSLVYVCVINALGYG